MKGGAKQRNKIVSTSSKAKNVHSPPQKTDKAQTLLSTHLSETQYFRSGVQVQGTIVDYVMCVWVDLESDASEEQKMRVTCCIERCIEGK